MTHHEADDDNYDNYSFSQFHTTQTSAAVFVFPVGSPRHVPVRVSNNFSIAYVRSNCNANIIRQTRFPCTSPCSFDRRNPSRCNVKSMQMPISNWKAVVISAFSCGGGDVSGAALKAPPQQRTESVDASPTNHCWHVLFSTCHNRIAALIQTSISENIIARNGTVMT